MPYIGNQPGTGVRNRFIYTATASQTTFSGADDNGKTLKYADSDFVDVFLNGVCLVPAVDYTSTTKTSVVLTQAASLNDTLEVIAYDIATIADTVSKADGGTFEANVTFADGADLITASKGTDNVRLGENAGDSIASGGDENVVIGKDAGTAITTGDRNTAVGHQAGDAVTTGGRHTLMGYGSGSALIDSDRNVAYGYGSLQSDTKGSKSTAVGYSALNTQNFSSATDSHNTAVGYTAGESITTGSNNTLVGSLAGDAMTTCASNTAVGQDALGANQTSNSNTAVGKGAGASTTQAAGTYVGTQAGENTNSVSNTFIGCSAGELVTSGQKNTILGRYNGNENSLDIRTSSNNIVLSDGDGAARMRIDSSGNTHMFKLQINTTGSGDTESMIRSDKNSTINSDGDVTFVVFSDGDVQNTNNSYGAISDQNKKENIVDATDKLDDINNVKIRNFNFIGETKKQIGVIAQELETVFPALVKTIPDTDRDGNDLGTETKSVKYSVFVPMLIKAMQELSAKVDVLETENTAIKARLDALEAE